MPPVIALLTDFGFQDPQVGAMKGAILSVCPEATLVDVLHEVPARARVCVRRRFSGVLHFRER